MEIKRKERGKVLEIQIEGRLDAYWADHLNEELSAAVREGHYRIVLNFSGLSYISSAGVRVLMRFYKQLRSLDGAFSIMQPSETVHEVLRIMRLDDLLAPPSEKAEAPEAPQGERAIELDTGTLRVYPEQPDAELTCRAIGDATAFPGRAFEEKDCHPLSLPKNAFAIGLGALESGYEDCKGRFGEFIAAPGAAAYLPTDRGNVPDYMVSAEQGVTDLQVLYCLACEGGVSHVVHFESKPDLSLSLLDLAVQCLDITGADAAGFVMAAEIEGLVGAALKRSPALAAAGERAFHHPGIRDWMMFTTEPAYARGVALVAGVVSQKDDETLVPFLRPLGREGQPQGHLHAAAFSYRPMKKGKVDLAETVYALFEGEMLQGILHLVHDTRPIAGTGQSEFVRGTCWVAPIRTVEREE
ncbi:MAG: STAS domain-containing protein [Planctomycetes bacterium]|nr:STAS domain-containing protein [Planctomycetota bacterium]